MKTSISKKNKEEKSLQVGKIYSGKVTGIKPFGAFVKLNHPDLVGDTIGMVHVSQVSRGYIKNINDYLKFGQEIKVRVVSINNGKISLSMVLEEDEGGEISVPNENNKYFHLNDNQKNKSWSKRNDMNMTLDEKISKFKIASDENFKALRDRTEKKSKRKSAYAKKSNKVEYLT